MEWKIIIYYLINTNNNIKLIWFTQRMRFLNFVKLNQILIVITLHRLIWFNLKIFIDLILSDSHSTEINKFLIMVELTDWFATKRNSARFTINRKMVNTIWFRLIQPEQGSGSGYSVGPHSGRLVLLWSTMKILIVNFHFYRKGRPT